MIWHFQLFISLYNIDRTFCLVPYQIGKLLAHWKYLHPVAGARHHVFTKNNQPTFFSTFIIFLHIKVHFSLRISRKMNEIKPTNACIKWFRFYIWYKQNVIYTIYYHWYSIILVPSRENAGMCILYKQVFVQYLKQKHACGTFFTTAARIIDKIYCFRCMLQILQNILNRSKWTFVLLWNALNECELFTCKKLISTLFR